MGAYDEYVLARFVLCFGGEFLINELFYFGDGVAFIDALLDFIYYNFVYFGLVIRKWSSNFFFGEEVLLPVYFVV